jgi:hypothetical protein
VTAAGVGSMTVLSGLKTCSRRASPFASSLIDR